MELYNAILILYSGLVVSLKDSLHHCELHVGTNDSSSPQDQLLIVTGGVIKDCLLINNTHRPYTIYLEPRATLKDCWLEGDYGWVVTGEGEINGLINCGQEKPRLTGKERGFRTQ